MKTPVSRLAIILLALVLLCSNFQGCTSTSDVGFYSEVYTSPENRSDWHPSLEGIAKDLDELGIERYKIFNSPKRSTAVMRKIYANNGFKSPSGTKIICFPEMGAFLVHSSSDFHERLKGELKLVTAIK